MSPNAAIRAETRESIDAAILGYLLAAEPNPVSTYDLRRAAYIIASVLMPGFRLAKPRRSWRDRLLPWSDAIRRWCERT